MFYVATLTYLLPGAENGGGEVAGSLSCRAVDHIWGTGATQEKEGKFLGL